MAGKQRRGRVHTDLHGGSPFDGLKEPFEEKDQILLAMNAVAVNVMARKRKADERWGLDRLAELVSEETRLRFWKQLGRCRLAYQARDVEGYRSACGGMMRAYDALEKEAETLGAEPVTVSEYLKRQGIPGIEGIDTRRLVRILRETGAKNGVLVAGDYDLKEVLESARKVRSISDTDYVLKVTSPKPAQWQTGEHALSFRVPGGRPERWTLAAIDYGVKHNILRKLHDLGAKEIGRAHV